MIDITEASAQLTVSPERAAQMLNLGRTKVFALLADGELPLLQVPAQRSYAVADIRAQLQATIGAT